MCFSCRCCERRTLMLRVSLAVASVLSLCVGTLLIAGSQDPTKSGAQTNQGKAGAQVKTDAQMEKNKATITNMDAKNHTITVKMKDKSGNDKERVFKLTEDIRYFDSTGKTA